MRNILKVPGRLCYGPTDLSTDYPHGGTALGMFRDVEFRAKVKSHLVTAEEWGGQTTEVLMVGESCVLACVLREFDDDALSAMFLNTATGSSSGKTVIQGNAATSAKRAGTKLSAKAVKLYFSPDAPEHPGVLIYKAIPLIEETATLQLVISEELGVGAVWHGIPDATKRCYAIGRREDLSL